MTIDDYIQYWACLCESEDGSYVILEKRNRRLNRSNHIDKNLHHLNTPEIRKVRNQRIETSLSALGQHKDFLDVFADGRSRSLPPIRYRGIAYRVWLEEGDEMYGATHIAIKHLIDGGTAFRRNKENRR